MKVEVIKANGTRLGNKFQKTERLRVAAYCRVSTDTEDQLNSYNSQVKYYNELIQTNPEYIFAGIYADPGISGTQTAKRDEFNKMIEDAKNGKIDMILTKSISRFARNTLDTLKYVRLLKEYNVSVKFEEENINTLTMEGEMLLTILSSVAQQEVENISQNVKKGLKMKMQRGEMVGFQKCLGYRIENDELVIVPEEAEIVKFIFDKYLSGLGANLIAKELTKKGYEPPKNGNKWASSTVTGILKNEKYKGDLILGKTYTLNPITKRRLKNHGEEESYFIKDHHTPIIDRETWDQVDALMKRRSKPRKDAQDDYRDIKKRMHAFSLITECGYCGSTVCRKTRYSSTKYSRGVWRCMRALKEGVDKCPQSVVIDEEVLQNAFMRSFNRFIDLDQDKLETFFKECIKELSLVDNTKEIDELEKKISKLNKEKDNLMNLRLENTLTTDDFNNKYVEYQKRIYKVQDEINKLKDEQRESDNQIRKIKSFLNSISSRERMEEFNREIFEAVIEKVIIGVEDKDGKKDPYLIRFMFIGGIETIENVITYPQFMRRLAMKRLKDI